MTIDEKDLYVENYKTLLREIKEALKKWRTISRVGTLNTVKTG